MDLSIIIVSWNVKRELKNCLTSIRSNISNLNYEIIVVDNNSDDNTCNMIKNDFSYVNLICNNHNRGYGAANNQGIVKAKGEFILILNPDTLMKKGTAYYAIEFLRNKPEAGVCGPSVFDKNGLQFHPMMYDPTIIELIGKDTFLRRIKPKKVIPHYPFPNKQKKVDRVSGCCFFVKTEAIKSAGMFDERIFLFYEEADLFYRLRAKGYEVYYLPEISIIHLHGKSVSRLTSYQKELITRQSSLIYLKKRYSLFTFTCFRLFMLFSYSVYLLILFPASIFDNKSMTKQKKKHYLSLVKIITNSLIS